jgi:hypothetical protein
MIQDPRREPDRRHSVRIEAKASVAMYALGNVHRGRLQNLAAGGMYLLTQGTVPVQLLGQACDFELRFDGPLDAWQRLSGRVSRIDGHGLAVAFEGTKTPTLLRVIDELETASLASARVISVVLVDEDATRRARMAAGFRAIGCTVVEVGTALEMIVRLGESRFEPDVIALTNPQAGTASEMRAFVDHAHPSSLIVTIGPELLDPAGLENWLSSASAAADLPGRIRGLLFGAPAGTSGANVVDTLLR